MDGTLRLGDVEVCVALCAAAAAVDTDIRYESVIYFVSVNQNGTDERSLVRDNTTCWKMPE